MKYQKDRTITIGSTSDPIHTPFTEAELAAMDALDDLVGDPLEPTEYMRELMLVNPATDYDKQGNRIR